MDNEAVLVEQMQQGNEEAFAELYAAHRRSVYRSAYLVAGNATEAEDILQQTFFQLWRWRARVKAPLLPWLLKVATNQALSLWRRRREFTLASEDLPDVNQHQSGADVDEQVFARQVIDVLWQLPRRQRAVCVLRLLHEFTEEETASMLACRPGTVRATLFHARERIRRTLGIESA